MSQNRQKVAWWLGVHSFFHRFFDQQMVFFLFVFLTVFRMFFDVLHVERSPVWVLDLEEVCCHLIHIATGNLLVPPRGILQQACQTCRELFGSTPPPPRHEWKVKVCIGPGFKEN